MATVGKNIHKQRICTIKRKSSGRRIQPYLTLFPSFATEKLSVSACKEDWQRAAKKSKDTVMSLLLMFYLSFCV